VRIQQADDLCHDFIVVPDRQSRPCFESNGHRKQRLKHERKPTRPPLFATIITAAKLGPKLPANTSNVAGAGDGDLNATDKPQHAHDQAKVKAKKLNNAAC
jgi:hypothetical protein